MITVGFYAKFPIDEGSREKIEMSGRMSYSPNLVKQIAASLMDLSESEIRETLDKVSKLLLNR
jgi:hypothetical protein